MAGWVDLGYLAMHWPGVELATFRSRVRCPTTTLLRHPNTLVSGCKHTNRRASTQTNKHGGLQYLLAEIIITLIWEAEVERRAWQIATSLCVCVFKAHGQRLGMELARSAQTSACSRLWWMCLHGLFCSMNMATSRIFFTVKLSSSSLTWSDRCCSSLMKQLRTCVMVESLMASDQDELLYR